MKNIIRGLLAIAASGLALPGIASESAPASLVNVRQGAGGVASDNRDHVGPGQGSFEELEEILVTGTHIRGVRNQTAAPIVIDRDAIARTGYSSTAELMRSIPLNFAGGQTGATDDGRFGTGSSVGLNFTSANGINLRGLGDSSTLVLLNGRRIAPSAYGTVVDISLIPLAAIERVEILPDGSSALYGSDAVAGVVNIITKSDYEGASTLVRYGAAAESSRAERLVAQTIGWDWDSGNVVAAAQYQDQSALQAEDRRFARGLTTPNDLLPDTVSYGVSLNARHQVTPAILVYADSLFSRRATERGLSFPAVQPIRGHSNAEAQSTSVAAGFTYALQKYWSVDVSAQLSQQDSERMLLLSSSSRPEMNEVGFREGSAQAIVNGSLFETPAGRVGIALGGSHRREALTQNNIVSSGLHLDDETNRRVTAAFGELYVPVIGKENYLPLFEALELSFAVRWDDYSDVGSTSTPRMGLYWSPAADLAFRASYSESFRAPNAGEILQTDTAFLYVYPLAAPGGAGIVPAFLQLGSEPALKPERARTFGAGIEYEPHRIPGLKFGVSYYTVRYVDRIILPSFDVSALRRPEVYGSLITSFSSDSEAQAFLNSAIASGDQFLDLLGTGARGVRHVVDLRQQNAALVEQSGFDISASYTAAFSPGVIRTSISAATIDSIDTALAQGAASADLVGTLGHPLKWRGRFDAAWESRAWRVNIAANYAHHYVNNAVIRKPKINSWLTWDLVGRFQLDDYFKAGPLQGLAVTVGVQNIFNQPPPFVDASSLLRVNYDPANANPLQRVSFIELSKAW